MKKQIQRWLSLSLAMLFLFSSVRAEGVRILFIGDSITDGNWGGGGAKPSHKRSLWDMNHIFGHGFMSLCASHYMSRYPDRDYQFFNRGISGHGLYDLEKRWQSDVLDLQPDVLSILIGTNDIHHYLRKDKTDAFDVNAWEQTYRRLLDEARAQNPNLQLVLAAPFVGQVGRFGEQRDYPERARLIALLDAAVESIARDYHAIYLPYQDLFAQLLQDTSVQPASYWIWDGIHPTAAAHQQMADLWIKAVDPYLTRLAGIPAQQWDFNNLKGWSYEAQDKNPNQQCDLQNGMLRIYTRANSWDRKKMRTSERAYRAGRYTWRTYIPEMGVKDQASIGSWIYCDDHHELDFEVGYGKESVRRELNAAADEVIVYMTSQDFPYATRAVPMKPGWHLFEIDLQLVNGTYKASWLIDHEVKQELQLEYGEEIPFYIFCSVENLKFLGDQIPQQDNYGVFDYVRYQAY